MLFTTYGLRSGEVAGLQLDDLDWEEETLRVRRSKSGRTHLYPMSRSVGQAIVRYVREVRPARQERNVFLTLCAPFRPLGRCALHQVVSSRMIRLGIVPRHRGPHALRHATAQHLLDQGQSMKVIGDYLGHRNPSSVSVYAKVESWRPSRSRGLRSGGPVMKIRDAIGQYIAWRQTHGTQFKSGSALLHCFLKGIDREISCDAVTEAQVRSFLGGKGPLTRYRTNKYAALAGFYRYAISRGSANCSPLPDNEPKKPPVAPPYIYSHDELRCLFGAIDIERSRAIRLDAPTFRTLLLLLYGAGLRRTEALQLTLADVDLSGTVLTVRNSKFYRSRLVPVGAQLAEAIEDYAGSTCTTSPSAGECFILSCEPGRNAIGEENRQWSVRRAASRCRNRWCGRQTPIPAPAFIAPYVCHEPPDRLVPAGCRCATAATGALHLSRSQRPDRHPSLPIDDIGVAATGLAPLRALCKRRER